MYSWGSGQYGKLGHNNLRDRFLPVRIGRPFCDGEGEDLDVTDISCNRLHSAAVTGNISACFLGIVSDSRGSLQETEKGKLDSVSKVHHEETMHV